jgi:hypothetical protein
VAEIEKIKTLKHIPDIEYFVNVAADLATFGVPTDENVTNTVLQNENSDHDSDEYIEETVHTKSLITYSYAQDAVQMLMNFSENSETVECSTFNVLSIIKDILER